MALLSRTYVRYNYKKGDDYMATICTLAPDINSCPHYDQKKGICRDGPKICGFYTAEVIQETKERYHRQPRWYEKYIK